MEPTWKNMIRTGMALIKEGCRRNEGMCNGCPFFNICDEINFQKNHELYYVQNSPENWRLEIAND